MTMPRDRSPSYPDRKSVVARGGERGPSDAASRPFQNGDTAAAAQHRNPVESAILDDRAALVRKNGELQGEIARLRHDVRAKQCRINSLLWRLRSLEELLGKNSGVAS